MEAHQNNSMTPEADTIPGPAVFLGTFLCCGNSSLSQGKSVTIGAKWLNRENRPAGELKSHVSSQPTVSHWPRHGRGQTTSAPTHFQVLLAPLSTQQHPPRWRHLTSPPLAPHSTGHPGNVLWVCSWPGSNWPEKNQFSLRDACSLWNAMAHPISKSKIPSTCTFQH